jgi:hypothetical protein
VNCKSYIKLVLALILAVALLGCRGRQDIHSEPTAYTAATAAPLAGAEHSHRDGRWPTIRKHALDANPNCVACGKPATQVHHADTPVHIDPTRELDESQLVCLCGDCHLRFGHLGDWKAWNPCIREDAARHLAEIKARPYTQEQAATFRRRFSDN